MLIAQYQMHYQPSILINLSAIQPTSIEDFDRFSIESTLGLICTPDNRLMGFDSKVGR